MSAYDPSKPITPENRPAWLRMPPMKRNQKPKTIEKSSSETSEEVVLWSFDYPHEK